jgi:hypothetical protein
VVEKESGLSLLWVRDKNTGKFNPMNPKNGKVITNVCLNSLPPNADLYGTFDPDSNEVHISSASQETDEISSRYCPNCKMPLPDCGKACRICTYCGQASCE